ncbi:alpha/beta hydrolase [Sphingomonas sp.]|uniref:alpha/beta fold hydrolase n=1 Tax=Sphingomonas sp. TaxID=28214 RepID=UPI002BC1FB19|nr:alpha/beta hydrolase [Sphingomonas sp.]HTG39038.1 alpha/beta hydrolase [Sphingomonas sp.]
MQDTPAAALHVRHARVRANGLPFHVIEQGAGPAVLFCHGFPDTAETWRSQMRAVAEAGFRAIALDMRGFGQSYAPDDFRLYTSLHVTGDLIGVLDALDIDTAVIVGHDWGADYAQRACIMRPDRFRALISLSIPFAPRGDTSLWEDLRARGLGELYYAFGLAEQEADERLLPAADTIRSALYWLSASPPPGERWDPIDPAKDMLRPSPVDVPAWADRDYVDNTIRAFEQSGFHTGLNYYRVLQVTFDLTAAFKNATIAQPSLYIWGGADGLCRFFHPDPPAVEDLRPLWPGLVDVVELEDAGHWVQHEAAARVNAELVRFLQRHDVA